MILYNSHALVGRKERAGKCVLIKIFFFLLVVSPFSEIFNSEDFIALSENFVSLLTQVVFFTDIALIEKALVGLLEENRLEVQETKGADDGNWPPDHLLEGVHAPEQEGISDCTTVSKTLHLDFIAVFSLSNVCPVTFNVSLVESGVEVNDELLDEILAELRSLQFLLVVATSIFQVLQFRDETTS